MSSEDTFEKIDRFVTLSTKNMFYITIKNSAHKIVSNLPSELLVVVLRRTATNTAITLMGMGLILKFLTHKNHHFRGWGSSVQDCQNLDC